MSVSVSYRPAQPEDVDAIAHGIQLVGDGFLDFILPDVPDRTTPFSLLRQEVANTESILSYEGADVAIADEQVVGGILSIPVEHLEQPCDLDRLIPPDRYLALEDFFQLQRHVPESWYVDSLWVDAAYQRRGIGKQLIQLAAARGRAAGRQSLSLVAWAVKAGAIAFYEAQGFRQVAAIAVGQHPEIPHPEGFILFERNIV